MLHRAIAKTFKRAIAKKIRKVKVGGIAIAVSPRKAIAMSIKKK